MNKSSKHPYNGMKLTSRKPLITALEPRILLDGAALATTLEMTTDLDHQQTTTDVAKDTISPTMPDAPAPTQVKAVDPLLNNGRKEVVFIDTSVTDYQSLINGVSAGVEIELIDSSKDGLAQLTSWAQSNQDYDAIYLLSHGSSGQIYLGTVSIDNTNINDYADSLATIGQSLTTDGDLLVYGCDVAKSDSGKLLINSLAQLTQADVAASTNLTGSAALGGDWSLEYTQGQIDFGVLPDSALEAYDYTLATAVDLSGKDGWTAIMYGVGKDPQGDSQAGAADTDIIGDATHGSLYTAYSDGGTPNDTSDDYLYFRMRIDNPTSTTNFNGVAIVGLDANGDGRVDLFISVDARNNTQAVRLLDPGTGLNNSPNTTTTSALPTGWLANNGMYDFTNSNFSVVAVSAATDPNWDGDTDVGNNGDNDAFISWRVPLADLTTVLAKASPTDRYGNYGPRGSTGIAGFSQDTTVSYVSFTQTQPGPINGDLNGVGKSYDKNATFAQLGAFTAPMTASDPVSASDFVRINSPISSDGLINATEDNSVAISGTASANQWVMLTVTDSTHTKTVWAQANSTGTWSLTTGTGDLSGFDEGTLTFDAKLVDANNSSTAIANASSDSVTAIHDTQAPSIEITPLATDGKPTINGISDLLAGSNIIVTIDPNGDGNLADKIMYTALVGTNGSWSVNTAVATPTSGSLPVTGLTAYAKITAEGTDTAGNTGTATAIDKPTVNSLTTQSVTPTVSGTWGGTNGDTDTLSVTVNGVTYTPTISGNTWSVVLNSSSLATGNTYDVEASVTRSSSAVVTDVTVRELTIVSGPVVIIAGSDTASTPNSKPTLSGTSTPGAVVTLQIDLDNSNSTTNDRVTYSAVADVNGNWSINTATATSISGTLPASGLSGTVGLLATVIDSNNRTATDTQTLTITVPSISIASVTGAHPVTSGISNDGILNSTEDNASVIYINTTNIATNQTIAVTVSDGVHSNVTGVASYDAVSSKWKTTLDLSSLNDGTNALNILASFNSGQVTATTQVSHDSEAYASVTSAQTTSAPDISGTADVTSSSLVIKIDRYTKQGSSISFSNTTYYSVAGGTIGSYLTASGVTLTGNVWSLPSSQSGGSFNNPGEYIFATVIGTDAAGNTVNATGQVTQIANNGTPNTISINTIAGDNIINESEDNSVSISGTTTVSGGYILVTLTDGSNSISQQVQATGTSWSLSNLNLDNWKDGPIQVEAKLLSASNSTTVVASALATPTHVNSVTAAPTIAISNPIGDGNLSANEDSSVTVSGTTTNAIGSTVTVTIGGTKIGTATVASNGTWSTTFDSGHSNALSSLADGTLNVSASVTANSTTATDSTTVLHDRTPPAITITPQLTTGKPTIQGTTDLTAGSIISVTIDPDNNSGTSDTVTYQATVLNSGTWSIDLSSATPITGSLSQAGLTAYAKITATGTDAAGNSTTTTALDKPVVNTNLTNSETPTLTGTWTYISGDVLSVLVANSGNTVSHTYTAGDGHLVANSDNTWTLTIPASDTLPANTYNVTATVTRNSATASDTTSAELVVDTAAPSVEITQISNDSGSSSSDFVTNDNSLIFSGSAETDSNVLITLKDAANNTIFTTTVVASGGVWSIDRNDQTDLPDGHYTLTATATDAAGNSATDVQNIEIDTKATISITTNYKSASTTPIISGTSDLEAGRPLSVTVTDNGSTFTYSTTVGSDGSWSINTATAVPQGFSNAVSYTESTDDSHLTITVSGQDQAGNAAGTSKAMVIDTSAPSVHISTPLDSNGDLNGILTITEDSSVVIQGTTAKSTSTTELAGYILAITITDGNMTISDTATVLSDGSWQLAPLNLRSMASGYITVNATYIDDSGVAYTDIATILHDKTATVSIDSISSDTGIQGDFVTADNTLVFSGSATPNSTVTLSLSGPSHTFSNVIAPTNDNGVWSHDYHGSTLTDGNYTLSASVIGTTVTQNISIDTAIPTGAVTVNSLTTNDRSPTVTGTAVVNSGESLSVTVNGVTYSTDDSDLSYNSSLHTWSLTIPNDETHELSPAVNGGFDGVYSVTATIRDAAGNVLNDSTTRELLIDTTPPVAPTPSLTTDSGSSNTDKLTNVGTLSLSGVETDALVEYSTNGIDWTDSFTPVEGTNTVYVRQTDLAGNVSASSAAFTFVRDTVVPTIALTSNVASLHAGQTATVTFTLSEAATDFDGSDILVTGGTLSNFTGSGTSYTATFTPDASSTADGHISVDNSRFTDAAGNANTNSNQLTLNIDTAIPVAPTLSLATDSGSSNTDKLTNVGTLSLSGVETDAVVEYSINGIDWTSSFTPVEGTNTVYVRQTDLAGNVSASSAAFTFVRDTVVPTIALTSNVASLHAGQTATVTFTLSEAATDFDGSDILVTGGTLSNFTGSGTSYTATFTPDASSTADGHISVDNSHFTDAAGNANTNSNQLTLNIDTAIPVAPTPSLSTDSGSSNTDKLTNVGTLSLTGVETDAVVGYSTNGTDWTDSFTPVEGSNTVYVRQTDSAGNVSASSSAFTFVQDTVVPTIALTSNVTSLHSGQTATVTFTLSEAATDFDINDIVVTGGTLSNFTGSGTSYTATFTPDASSTATGHISVASSRFNDAAGNANTNSNQLTLNIDTAIPVAPTLSLATDSGSSNTDKLTNVGTLSLTGVETDAVVEYSTNGTDWTSSFTPVDGTNTVYVRQTDLAGNVSAPSAAFTFVRDTAVPTVSIQNAPATHSGNAFTVTLEFNEDVTGFAVGDLSVSGASLSNFTAIDGNTYVVTVTPLGTNAITLDVPASVAQDGAGNNNAAATQINIGYSSTDTVAPTIALTSNVASLHAGQTATVTFTLSEAVTDFDGSDIVVTGGTLSNFTGSGTSYTATFTPDASSTADGTIRVDSSRFTDAAGNANTDGTDSNNALTFSIDTAIPVAPTLSLATDSGSSNTDKLTNVGTLSLSGVETDAVVEYSINGIDWTSSFTPVEGTNTVYVRQTDLAGNVSASSAAFTFVQDTVVPTIALTSNVTSLHSGQTATVTFTLSEAATDFDINDIVVTGGTLSNFTGSGTTYTATFTPDASSTADGTIRVDSSRFTDAAGNANTDGTDSNNALTFSIDTAIPVAPTLSLATDSGSSNTDKLTNIGTLSLSGVETDAVVEYSTNGTDWTDSFTPVEGSNTVYVRQTDSAGNVSASSSAFTFVQDTVVPTIALTSNVTSLHSGQTATVTFTLSEAATDFDINDIVVTGGTLSNFTGSGTSYTATFTPDASSTATGHISVASSRFNDAAGNANTNSNQLTLNIDTAIPVAPTLSLATDSGSSNTDKLTNVGTLSLTGVETDAVVEYSTNGTDWTSSFTPVDGTNTVYVRQTDLAGNVSAPSAAFTFVRDTAVPTVSIQNAPATHSGNAFTVTLEFNEDVTGFAVGDLSVSGASLSNFTAIDGNTYVVTVTPLGTNAITLDVPASVAQDGAGNNNAAATQINIGYSSTDTVAPTIALTSNVASLHAGQTATVTFTLSEAVTDFDGSDIVVTGGTLSNFTGSGTSYTATFTPDASSTADGTIRVDSSRFTDAAGNANTDGTDSNNALTFSIDTAIPVAPTLSLATDSGSSNTDKLTNVGTLSLSGVETDAVVEYSINGIDWTSSFTPVEGTNTVYVRQTDLAGNVSAPSAAFTFVRDTTNPNNATGLLSVAERSANGTIVGIVSATDNIGPVTYSLSDNAGGRFTIDSSTGAVTVTNDTLLDDEINSSHNITVTITDAAGNQTNTVLSVAVTAVNRTPIAVNDTASAHEAGGTNNTTLGLNPSGNVLTNDLDPDSADSKQVSAILFGSNTGVVGQALDGNYGALTLLSNGNYSYVVNNALAAVQALHSNSDVLTETFTYTVQDAGGLTSTATLKIIINGENDAPVVSNDSQDSSWNFGRDYYKDISTLFTDVDSYGEKLVYSISGLPAGLTFDPVSGIISGQPVNAGNFNITISATDSSGAVVSKNYALTIIAPAQTVIPVIVPTPTEIQPTPAPPVFIPIDTVEPAAPTLPSGVITSPGISETSGFIPSSADLPITADTVANTETTTDDPALNPQKIDEGANIVSVDVNADGKVIISDIPQQANDAAGLSIKNVELSNGDIQVYIIDAKPSQNYSATLSDGTALPDWVSIDPVTGALSITPPPGEKDLVIKIYATSTDGAIRILEVKLNVEDLAKQQRVAKTSPHAEFIPLEQQFSMETATIDGYGERIASLLVV